MAVPRESIKAITLLCIALLSIGAECNVPLPLGSRRGRNPSAHLPLPPGSRRGRNPAAVPLPLGSRRGPNHAVVPLPLGSRRGGNPAARTDTIFNVRQYGANGDGKSDDAMKFMRAWNAACQSKGPAKLVIPRGTFMVGEVDFQGPCNGLKPITIEIQGTLLSNTDLSVYTRGVWITVEYVDGVIITGKGTLNGRGEASWRVSSHDPGNLLPTSLQLQNVKNSVIRDISLVNSKGFHMKVTDCINVTVTNVKITAPVTSPNTDGLHISDSEHIIVSDSVIGTGDDCISVGDSNKNILISNITCGPGHGISVGSLGKRIDEKDVIGVKVIHCKFIGTTNGARIKTYRESPSLQASDIIYEDIIMDRVHNPIVIDQHYNSKNKKQPSKVKISNVHFRNIRGTTLSPVAVWLNCSKSVPCQGIELTNINLMPAIGRVPLTSACENVIRPTFLGMQRPGRCM